MKSFAGTVCASITIVIYGIAVICGISYHYLYFQQEEQYTSQYFIVWIGFLCVAAVISAIHHALWTIIDNQLLLYAELEKQREMLEDMKSMREGQRPELQQENGNNIPSGSDNKSNLFNWDMQQWTCDVCGTVNTKSQCTNCGQMRY